MLFENSKFKSRKKTTENEYSVTSFKIRNKKSSFAVFRGNFFLDEKMGAF